MAFKDSYRLEKVYFENIYTLLNMLKSTDANNVDMETVKELLRNAIADNESIILIYKNLGELYSYIADRYSELDKMLKDLQENLESWKDEINEKIDDLNNFLSNWCRELDDRLSAVEEDLRTMNRNIFLTLVYNADTQIYSLKDKGGNTVDFNDVTELLEFPHNVIVRYESSGDVTEYELRNYDDSSIEFFTSEMVDNGDSILEVIVTIASNDAVTVTETFLNNPLYTFGTGLSLDSNNELSVDFSTVQAKLTEGTGIDIDSNNEISVDTTVIQEKLTEGTGIDIDSNNEISVDTTVIQEKLTEGFGIDIDSNNEIKVDTNDVQEKLIAGQNITLTPDSTDPTKTVIDASGGGSDPTTRFPYYVSSNKYNFSGLTFSEFTDHTDQAIYFGTLSTNDLSVSSYNMDKAIALLMDSTGKAESSSNDYSGDANVHWFGQIILDFVLTLSDNSSKTIPGVAIGFLCCGYTGSDNTYKRRKDLRYSKNLIDISGYIENGLKITKIKCSGRYQFQVLNKPADTDTSSEFRFSTIKTFVTDTLAVRIYYKENV